MKNPSPARSAPPSPLGFLRKKHCWRLPALGCLCLFAGATHAEVPDIPNDFAAHFSFDAATFDPAEKIFRNNLGNLRIIAGNGTVGNGPGQIAQAADFEAGPKPSCRIAAAGVAVGDIARESFTISLWFNSNANSALQMLVTKGRTDAHPAGYNILLRKAGSTGQVIVTLCDGEAPAIQKNYDCAPPGGEWTHLALVVDRDENSATVFVNGTPLTAVDGNAISPTLGSLGSGFELNFGTRYPFGDLAFNGSLDDAGFWKRALSPAEIASIYQAGLEGKGLE